MEGWLETEAEQGRSALVETPALVLDGVSAALQIIEDMRAADELPAERGYQLKLVAFDLSRAIPA